MLVGVYILDTQYGTPSIVPDTVQSLRVRDDALQSNDEVPLGSSVYAVPVPGTSNVVLAY